MKISSLGVQSAINCLRAAWLTLPLVSASVLFGALYLSLQLENSAPQWVKSPYPVTSAVLFVGVHLLSMYALGLFRVNYREREMGSVIRICLAIALGNVLLWLLYMPFPTMRIDSSVVLVALSMSALLLLFIQPLLIRRLRGLGRKRIMVIGSRPRLELVKRRLRRRSDQRSCHIVALIDPKVESLSSAQLQASIKNDHIDEIVLAGSCDAAVMSALHGVGIHVINLASFFEREINHLPLEALDRDWFTHAHGLYGSSLQRRLKRGFDLVLLLLTLPLSLPLAVLLALAVRCENPGAPVLYRQRRVGLAGREFDLIKFRSMRPDAESHSAIWASVGDTRITRIGRILRPTRLDELPQLWNILRGDMSWVGPRPERPEFVVSLRENILHFDLRHAVPPGLTGWAQIHCAYADSIDAARSKQEWDLYYVKNASAWLDVRILLQTFETVCFFRGAR